MWSNYKTSTALIMTEIKAINHGKVVGFLKGKMTKKTQMRKFMVLLSIEKKKRDQFKQ